MLRGSMAKADYTGLQSLIPVVMAGIIAVYSLVISVLIAGDVKPPPNSYSLFEYAQMSYRASVSSHC